MVAKNIVMLRLKPKSSLALSQGLGRKESVSGMGRNTKARKILISFEYRKQYCFSAPEGMLAKWL